MQKKIVDKIDLYFKNNKYLSDFFLLEGYIDEAGNKKMTALTSVNSIGIGSDLGKTLSNEWLEKKQYRCAEEFGIDRGRLGCENIGDCSVIQEIVFFFHSSGKEKEFKENFSSTLDLTKIVKKENKKGLLTIDK